MNPQIVIPKINISQNQFRKSYCLFAQKLKDVFHKRNTFGDVVTLSDSVCVYEGNKLKFASKGHIVNQGLIAIVNFLGAGSGTMDPTVGWYMRVGTGGSVTTGATTALTSQDSTAANTTGGVLSNPSGSYRIAWTHTWNAGTLAAITITELGLFIKQDSSLNTFAAAWSAGVSLFSRLSAADSDFTGFAVNTAVPLTIEWRLTLTFA